MCAMMPMLRIVSQVGMGGVAVHGRLDSLDVGRPIGRAGRAGAGAGFASRFSRHGMAFPIQLTVRRVIGHQHQQADAVVSSVPRECRRNDPGDRMTDGSCQSC